MDPKITRQPQKPDGGQNVAGGAFTPASLQAITPDMLYIFSGDLTAGKGTGMTCKCQLLLAGRLSLL